ncbi:hypothetical protein LPEKDOOE_00206 [Salmonella phage KKP 3953]|nr:hypothetical protein LPEKDOOE_00206 [Salmonella phage KKP 3953]
MTNKKEEKTNLFHTVRQSNEYTFFFDEELGSPDEYRDLSMILMQAGEDDEINLMINGPGGYVDTAAQLSNLIANCRGTVIGHLLGPSVLLLTAQSSCLATVGLYIHMLRLWDIRSLADSARKVKKSRKPMNPTTSL